MKLQAVESTPGEFDALDSATFEARAREGLDLLLLAFGGEPVEKAGKPFPRDGGVDALGEMAGMLAQAHEARMALMARAVVESVRAAGVPMAKGGGPYIGPRGGKWADPTHTVPWHDGVDHYAVHSDAHAAVKDVAVAAAHRAAAAGAHAESLKYIGAGAEGIVFADKTGRAYKVGRSDDREALRGEHDAAVVVGKRGLGPKVHKFDAKHGVIVRDMIDGRRGGWADGAKLRQKYEEIARALHEEDFTPPEYKEDSFVVGDDGDVKMIDVGFAQPRGKRLAAKVRAMRLEAATDFNSAFDAQLDIAHAFEDGAIDHAEAEAFMRRIGHDGQRKHGLEIIGMKAGKETIAKGAHRAPSHGGGPFIGPRGGKWADAAHTVPWKEDVSAADARAHAVAMDEGGKHGKAGAGPTPADVPHVRVTVPISDLDAIDPADRGRVDEYAKRTTPIPAVHAGYNARSASRGKGKIYVANGNHRVAAAKARGDTHIEVVMPAADHGRWEGRMAKAEPAHRVPSSSHPVELGPPPARARKRFPHQGTIDFQGLRILVENRAGSYRTGTDGDGLDAYVGPNADSPLVVVVHQQDPETKAFDEDKVMLGFDTVADALALYRKQYDRPGFYGGHEAMPIGRLLRWAKDPANRGKRVRKSAGFAALLRTAARVDR